MKQVKIPTSIMDVYHEMAACRQLAKEHDTGWFPSLKAIIYTAKAEKLYRFADRAMQNAFPQIKVLSDWVVDLDAGAFVFAKEPIEVVPKKTRKPKEHPVLPGQIVNTPT